MIVIADILTEAELTYARGTLANADWRDGATTAGGLARTVKRNEQADLTSRAGQSLHALLTRRIFEHTVFQAFCRPRRMTRLLVSKTVTGGGYGDHIDNALMGPLEDRLRVDIAFTLFLSAPDSYEGGALSIDTPLGRQSVRLNAGTMVAYAARSIHKVDTVTAAERLVCVGWAESLIRHSEQRDILWDLERLRTELVAKQASADALLTLDRAFANLLRQWVD